MSELKLKNNLKKLILEQKVAFISRIVLKYLIMTNCKKTNLLINHIFHPFEEKEINHNAFYFFNAFYISTFGLYTSINIELNDIEMQLEKISSKFINYPKNDIFVSPK